MSWKRALVPLFSLAFIGAAATIPWTELTEADWLYAVATRFTLVNGHPVHYPTPTAELVRLLEQRKETDALRQLADARLALGDRKGAVDALQRWAEAAAKAGPRAAGEAWAEAAHWCEGHGELALAFQDSARALPDLEPGAKRTLADARVAWADRHPDLADPLAMRQERAALFPDDGRLLEDWVRALEQAGKLDEADRALGASHAFTPERRLLLRADLATDHGRGAEAFRILDEAAAQPWSPAYRQAYAKKVAAGAPTQPATWRATLETRYDAGALVRLATLFEGQGRGDAAAGLLDQVERRYGRDLKRPDWLLLARLRREIDAIPEAFRDRLAAAQQGSEAEQTDDLAALALLALKAGGRPLPWGTFNDESYRWAAALDRTPGFWTGGLSFLLTGQNWKEALDRLESESLPDRTFGIARALADLLARRAPSHPQLPAVRVALMARFVERGEGQAALDLLPQVEHAAPAVADEARRIALLAARQVDVPVHEESRLFKARLAHAAPDGSRPSETRRMRAGDDGNGEGEEGAEPARPRGYQDLLEEALQRLDARDASHRAALDLILTELDRLPDDEELWLSLASRLEGWNLDDDLGPRLDAALQRFHGPGIWDKAARWYARRNHQENLRKLASDLAARFRGSALFERARAEDVLVDAPGQGAGGGSRLVRWADWVRLKALERFPHSPRVVHEAARLVPEHVWQTPAVLAAEGRSASRRVVVGDALLDQRQWAVLFVDEGARERFFAGAMKAGTLEAQLDALEAKRDRTPVEDQLLFEGRARLSQFERALQPAERLAAAYPGDGGLAQRVLTLHRSLNGLDGAQAPAARALVERTAPALEDASGLWTNLGELEEDRGHPEAAIVLWRHLMEQDPRNPEKVANLATLLWDYNHDREALAVVEQGRKLMGRPRFFAFETGVLRENVKDLDGALREYLAALEPENDGTFSTWYDQDQRTLRRLAQLLGHPRAYRAVEARIQGLHPGVAADEHALAAFLPLATLETPAPGLDWDADAWIDAMDQPNDPVGRQQRADRMAQARPAQHDAIQRLGDLLLAKAREMIPAATTPAFLDAIQGSAGPLIRTRWKEDQAFAWQNLLLARRAQLAPTEEARIQQEIARADFLAAHGRRAEGDALWGQLAPRIGALPEGPVRMRTEAQRAAFLERTQGAAAADREWQRLSERYPWSLGILQDHAAFLDRTGRGAQARALLEGAVPRAAAGHREALLERLTREALTASDLDTARRAVTRLLAEDSLEDGQRLAAIHLLGRLSWRQQLGWDAAPLIQAQQGRLKPDSIPDLYHQLALAADLEGASAPALGLWIEALNRRTGRDWIQEAARSTRRAGTGAKLLAFFEKQRQRSPRDVRWAVAVRDLQRDQHDVAGAIATAREAVSVRPEEEILWREAADLMVRDDRLREAADYLAGWARPRPADEGVAGWRSELYSRAGDGAQALAVEKAALEAYRRLPQATDSERTARLARAMQRLVAQGHPDLALRLGSSRNDIRDVAGVLSEDQQCRLAFLVGQGSRYLLSAAGREGALSRAAAVLRQEGRVAWLDEARTRVMEQILPGGRPDDQALQVWWPFVSASGLEPALRLSLAWPVLTGHPGPWQGGATVPFQEAVGRDRIGRDRHGRWVFRDPDLGRRWAQDLVRRDQGEALVAFLQPQWQALHATVYGTTPVGAQSPRLAWSTWLDAPEALAAWTRAASSHPEAVRLLGQLMADRTHWDRFWALAARGWDTAPLLTLLPPEARLAWFRIWDPLPSDPVLLARRRSVESVSEALGLLIQNAPHAVSDPLIVRLRGPRTVGEVLGHDAAWTWPEFTPRRNPRGELAETGDDRVIGQGVDQGRVPGALWGDRPGDAWYVLEALARYRQGDASAALLPLEPLDRGGEGSRTVLALHLAKALKDVPLALEIEAAHPGAARDRMRLEEKLDLLAAAGRKPEAAVALRDYLRSAQATLTEADYRWAAAQAEDRGLPAPLASLDPTRPVSPAFLAFLADRQPADATRFRTADPVGFRAALALRWQAREGQLGAGQVRRWVTELWAQGTAGLPGPRALAKLGPVWPHAAAWLARQAADRPGAVDALEQALRPGGSPAALMDRLALDGSRDDETLLAVRVRLARKEPAAALALLDAFLARQGQGQALDLGTPVPESAADAEGPAGDAPATALPDADPAVARLQAWLRPFREAGAAEAAEAKVRTLLQQARDRGPVSADAWRLAFELAPATERPALAQSLEAAWFRGDVDPGQAGPLADALSRTLPSEASRWLDRWPAVPGFAQAMARARILDRLKRPQAAAALLVATRRTVVWSAEEDLQAFDLWRKLGAAVPPGMPAPADWRDALPAWQASADAAVSWLAVHLRAHPVDTLAARAALRSPAPAAEEGLDRARLALDSEGGSEDASLLQLRAARGLLPGSWRAAATALPETRARDLARLLARRRFPAAEVDGALADLARLAFRAGETGRLQEALDALSDRRAGTLPALRAELVAPPGEVPLFTQANGRPALLRPRDLTWTLLAKVLRAEGSR